VIALYKLFMLGIVVRDLDPSESNNATNGLFGVVIKRDIPHRAAILFQEKVECAYKRMVMVGVGTPAAVAAALLAPHFIFAPLAFFIAGALPNAIPAFKRGLEYRGQGVETAVRAAKGETIEVVENVNAWQLSLYPQFDGVPVPKIEAGLRRWRGWSKRMAEAFRREWN
jgi:hypothetical protein